MLAVKNSTPVGKRGGETAVSGKLRTWEGWSSKNAWVSRANARDEWIARTSPGE